MYYTTLSLCEAVPAFLGAISNCLQLNLTVCLNKIVHKFKNLEESVI